MVAEDPHGYNIDTGGWANIRLIPNGFYFDAELKPSFGDARQQVASEGLHQVRRSGVVCAGHAAASAARGHRDGGEQRRIARTIRQRGPTSDLSRGRGH